jgi:hypothetical protein
MSFFSCSIRETWIVAGGGLRYGRQRDRQRFRCAGFVLHFFISAALLLQAAKVLDGMFVGAAEPGFVAREQSKAAVLRSQGGEGLCLARGFVEGDELAAEAFRLAVHLGIEHGGLDGPEAAETPAGGGDFVDQLHFEFILGLEAADAAVEQLIENLGRFVLQDEHFGRSQSVTEGVLGGAVLALEGAGSVGAAAVAARGFGFAERCHSRFDGSIRSGKARAGFSGNDCEMRRYFGGPFVN